MSGHSAMVEATAGLVGSRREARWLVEAAGEDEGRLREMVVRRRAGEPLQYILGTWSFRRLELIVDRRVLVPRPETEQVVEVALAELDRVAGKRRRVVDLGTGSGAVALSIATERTKVDVWATDISPQALEVAKANLYRTPGARVELVSGDWWSALPAHLRHGIDLAVANPPYVSTTEMADLDPQVRDWEPRLALEGGPRGTEAIEAILEGSRAWLAAGGAVVVELASHQGAAMAEEASRVGFAEVEVLRDLAGRDRILVARVSASASASASASPSPRATPRVSASASPSARASASAGAERR